jgi:hypothetical protein
LFLVSYPRLDSADRFKDKLRGLSKCAASESFDVR